MGHLLGPRFFDLGNEVNDGHFPKYEVPGEKSLGGE